jgi:hypothetical protein
MTTLIVILLQNVYYGDGQTKQKEQIENVLQVNNEVFEQEMKANPKTHEIFNLNEMPTTSNSAYFYFKDAENVIDENTLRRDNNKDNNPVSNANDEDETYFDRDHLTSKIVGLPSSGSSFMNLFKAKTTVDYNDTLQQQSQQSTDTRKQQKKTGIFFAYTTNKRWQFVLCSFSLGFYIYALVVLVNAVGRTPFSLFICPFWHSIVISVTWLYKKYVKK